MDGSIRLSVEERKALLRMYRAGQDVRTSRRAHIVLLLDDGLSSREVHAVVYAKRHGRLARGGGASFFAACQNCKYGDQPWAGVDETPPFVGAFRGSVDVDSVDA